VEAKLKTQVKGTRMSLSNEHAIPELEKGRKKHLHAGLVGNGTH